MKTVLFISIIFINFSIEGQEVKKDTLYFKFKRDYFRIHDVTPDQYYLIDSNNDGPFFFQKVDIFTNLKPKKVLCLKKYVRKSDYYDKSRYRKLYDYGLYEHFRDYIIFLVRKDEFIKVDSGFEID